MLAKWAEDDRQEMMKAEQRRQRKLEYRQLCNQLDVERHNQLIADKVASLARSICLSLHFTSVVDDAKCIVVTRVCVSVCLSVCLCGCPRPYAHTTARTRM